MLDMYKLAEWARLRARSRKGDVRENDAKNPRMYASVTQPFPERLLDACKLVSDSPKVAPDVLFVALPERLLGKCAYLCLDGGKKARAEAHKDRPDGITEDMIETLIGYDLEGKEAAWINLETPDQVGHIKHVLLCHGLSPIEDSIGLLADIGRAARTSWVLGVETEVMLADISWMSSNRSIRQFGSLTPREIDTGLRVCLDKRTRIYNAMNIGYQRHEIVPFDRAKTISGKKLEHISSRYLELARLLWGESAVGRLSHEHVRIISRQLDRLPSQGEETIPWHVTTLGHFPGALTALETNLKPHLEILRRIAKEFNSFDEDVFTYFFAQYYAQDGYRGNVLKVAPISERAFDKPFDELDPYFRAWGEGHSTEDVQAGYFQPRTVARMSVAYLPQYTIGSMTVLPYTPLSLDALRLEEKNHNLVRERLIMLNEPDENFEKTVDKNMMLLEQTPLIRRNRLLADVASFIMLAHKQGYHREIDMLCKVLDGGSLDGLLSRFPGSLSSSFARELEAGGKEDIEKYWLTWLKTVQIEPSPEYAPFHLQLYMLTAKDWTRELLKAAAEVIVVAQRLYDKLT